MINILLCVEIKALLGLCSLSYNIRQKINFCVYEMSMASTLCPPACEAKALPLGNGDFSLQTYLGRTHRAIIEHTPKVNHFLRVVQFNN